MKLIRSKDWWLQRARAEGDTPISAGGAFYAKPTIWQRTWRALGFRYHLGDDPPDADLLSGWMRTDMGMNFGWPDRLRLLMSGRLRIASIVHTDTPTPTVTKSRMDWHILAPGQSK